MTRRELAASQRQERRGAKMFGGKVTPGSGNGWAKKGDVRVPSDGGLFSVALVEFKWTGKTQFTLKAAELEKITYEAVADGRRPVFGVELNKQRYVVLPEDDYLELAGGEG